MAAILGLGQLFVAKILLFYHCFIFFSLVQAKWRPVVMMHGIGADNSSMTGPYNWIKEAFPGIYVKNVEIGNGYWDSFFIKMNDQVEDFCSQIRSDPELKDGFNLIGYSQGGLITRGFVERCNYPPVHNYITWSAPHGGTFGIPTVEWTWVFRDIWEMMYDSEIQSLVTFAQYWRDPYDLPTYLEKSIFLADINNARTEKNSTYKKNIMSLNAFVMLYTVVDTIVMPAQSGWFSTWGDKNDTQIVPPRETPLYKEDWIGLRYLDEQKRVRFYSCDCPHPDYPDESCRDIFNNYTLPFLNNTL